VNDIELAKKVAGGHADAMAILVDRYYAPLFRYLWHASGSREDAEDLASQTMIRARADIHGFRSSGPLRAWMYRVAHRELLRYRRRNAVARFFVQHVDVDDSAGWSEDLIVLSAALAQIPTAQRSALLLVEIEGLSVEEAAATLGVPAGTVKSRCFHAKKRLRELLATTYPEVANHAKPIPE